jgi:putative zinc finger/helix-turn-helix YgiT family protein
MNCYHCGGEMRSQRAKVPGEYAGEKFVVETEATVCTKCHHIALRADQIDAYTMKLADQYRARHRLFTSQEIRAIRNRLGMSQDEFAKYLNVGPASVKRWELGKAQDKSSDELIRLKSNLARAEQNVAEILFSQGGEADEFSGGRTFSIAKLGQVVLFFLHKAGERRVRLGSLHINKLCWYAGMRYARLPLGPGFDGYRLVFQELEKRGMIAHRGTDRFQPLQPFRAEEFPPEEVQTLEIVWNRFKGKLNQIVGESHEEKAWKQTPHAELISFRLVK